MRGWAFGLLAAIVLEPGLARAQDFDTTTADMLFKEGRSLLQSGDLALGCEKIGDSERMSPQLATLAALAACHEKLGKTATAWNEYKKLVTRAEKVNQSARAKAAQASAAALEPTLSKIRIKVASPPDGLVVTRDGKAVEASLIGTPIAVDPGRHQIEASAPGRKSWASTVDVKAGPGEIAVAVPELASGATSSSAAVPEQGNSPTASKSDFRRTLGFVLGGVGIAGLGVGSIFGVLTFSDKAKASPLCPNDVCNAQGLADVSSGKTKGLISTIAFPVGAAALGVGIALVVTSPKSASPTTGLELAPQVCQTGGGILALGRF